jgi:phosphate transport system protein
MATSSSNHHADISQVTNLTLDAFRLACSGATAAAEAIATGSEEALKALRNCEISLDGSDRDVDEVATSIITHVSESEARELLACMKIMVALERIGDLLLSFGNRVESVGPRIAAEDKKVLGLMATRLGSMLSEVESAYRERNLDRAVTVLRSDAEMDRLRNLIFLHHLETHDQQRHSESFHVLFMAQGLERGGDHAKNIAEEVCHLVSGRTVRHILRSYDLPDEKLFLEHLRAQHRDKQ